MMLRRCTEPGCTTQTLGGPCVAHDVAPRPAYVRGRPYAPADEDKQLSVTAGLTPEPLRSHVFSARA